MKKTKSYRPKSAAVIKPKKTKLKYPLTPEEMYRLSSRKMDIGIEGYRVTKKYFDYDQEIWKKKRAKILSSRKRNWPPMDWPCDKDDETRKVPPKRRTYLDDLYKWIYSYYSKERAEKILSDERAAERCKEYKKTISYDKIRRKDFLAREKEMKEYYKNKPKYPPHHEEAYEAAAEKIKEDEENKEDPMKKIYKRYKIRPQTARCDRVTIVAEAEHVGEQVPFYNTPENDDDDGGKKKLFYPSKEPTWRRAPAWKYPLPKKNMENLKFKEEAYKEKYNDYLDTKGITSKDLWIQVRDSFHAVTHHGENLHRICKEFKYQDTDQYQTYKENNPKVHIGPQQYWKTPKTRPGSKRKDNNFSAITDDSGRKVYFMDRRKTDKRVYIPNLRHAVY